MAFTKNTDNDWRKIGETDPYYGVLTFDQYKSSAMTMEALQTFFETGEKYVANIMSIIKEKLDPTYCPNRALDFGCGVGRVLIPLSKLTETITGVDVSEGMLNEARKNCISYNIKNAELIQSNGLSVGVSNKKYDFIHSFIVFQHIPAKRGLRLFEELLDHLEENGVGVVQFTYFRKASSMNNFFYYLVNRSGILSRIWNILKGRSIFTPIFQMNIYDTNRLLQILCEKGCHNVHIRFSIHGDMYYGAMLFFQKKQQIINGIE